MSSPNENISAEESFYRSQPDFEEISQFIPRGNDEFNPFSNLNLSCVVRAEGFPIAPSAKLDKLVTVILKVFNQIDPTVTAENVFVPLENDQSTGVCFVKVSTPKLAETAIAGVTGTVFAKNVLKATSIAGDVTSLITSKAALESHLSDKSYRDQFVVRYRNETEVFWATNSKDQQPVLITAGESEKAQRRDWCSSTVKWSPKGTYLVTYHEPNGFKIWGSKDFRLIGRFAHHGFNQIDFSPCEKYVVAYSTAGHDTAIYDIANNTSVNTFPYSDPLGKGFFAFADHITDDYKMKPVAKRDIKEAQKNLNDFKKRTTEKEATVNALLIITNCIVKTLGDPKNEKHRSIKTTANRDFKRISQNREFDAILSSLSFTRDSNGSYINNERDIQVMWHFYDFLSQALRDLGETNIPVPAERAIALMKEQAVSTIAVGMKSDALRAVNEMFDLASAQLDDYIIEDIKEHVEHTITTINSLKEQFIITVKEQLIDAITKLKEEIMRYCNMETFERKCKVSIESMKEKRGGEANAILFITKIISQILGGNEKYRQVPKSYDLNTHLKVQGYEVLLKALDFVVDESENSEENSIAYINSSRDVTVMWNNFDLLKKALRELGVDEKNIPVPAEQAVNAMKEPAIAEIINGIREQAITAIAGMNELLNEVLKGDDTHDNVNINDVRQRAIENINVEVRDTVAVIKEQIIEIIKDEAKQAMDTIKDLDHEDQGKQCIASLKEAAIAAVAAIKISNVDQIKNEAVKLLKNVTNAILKKDDYRNEAKGSIEYLKEQTTNAIKEQVFGISLNEHAKQAISTVKDQAIAAISISHSVIAIDTMKKHACFSIYTINDQLISALSLSKKQTALNTVKEQAVNSIYTAKDESVDMLKVFTLDSLDAKASQSIAALRDLSRESSNGIVETARQGINSVKDEVKFVLKDESNENCLMSRKRIAFSTMTALVEQATSSVKRSAGTSSDIVKIKNDGIRQLQTPYEPSQKDQSIERKCKNAIDIVKSKKYSVVTCIHSLCSVIAELSGDIKNEKCRVMKIADNKYKAVSQAKDFEVLLTALRFIRDSAGLAYINSERDEKVMKSHYSLLTKALRDLDVNDKTIPQIPEAPPKIEKTIRGCIEDCVEDDYGNKMYTIFDGMDRYCNVPSVFVTALQDTNKLSWANSSKYCSRLQFSTALQSGLISVYDTGFTPFSLLGSKSFEIRDVMDYSWCPRNDRFAYWSPSLSGRPMVIGVMNAPTRTMVSSRQLFDVVGGSLYWQSEGHYLCFHTYHVKRKTNILVFFRFNDPKNRELIDQVEIPGPEGSIIQIAWEPAGDRFAVLFGDAKKANISFYSMSTTSQKSALPPKAAALVAIPNVNAPPAESKAKAKVGTANVTVTRPEVHLCYTLLNQECSQLHWSPKGNFVVMSQFIGNTCNLTFFDVDNKFKFTKTSHDRCNSVSWDPSGRIVATSTICDRRAVGSKDDGVNFYDFQGNLINSLKKEKLLMMEWRPRPADDASVVKDVFENYELYQSELEEEQRILLEEGSAPLLEDLKKQIGSLNSILSANKSYYASL